MDPSHTIVLETPRLILRRFVLADLEHLWTLYCDPQITQYIPDAPKTYADAQEELEWHMNGHPNNPHLGLWATIHKDSGIFIGRCGLLPWTIDGRDEIEIAYTIARAHWRQGFGSEAARAIRDYAFTQLKITRLICVIDAENAGSRAVAQKIGMSFEKKAHDELGIFQIYSTHKD